MSDRTRVHEAVVVALWATQASNTVGEAAEVVTPAVLALMAEEIDRQAVQLETPPVMATWPLEGDLPPGGAYLAGWKAAGATLRARAETLRQALKDTADRVS